MHFEKTYKVDLMKPRGFVPDLGMPLFTGDDNSVRIIAELYSNGTAETATGTVKGYVILPNGMMTAPFDGEKDGNKVWIDLPDIALVMSGRIQAAIRLLDTNEETVILATTATVRRVDADQMIDPDGVVPTWEDILDKIQDMDDAVEACEDATEACTEVAESVAGDIADLKSAMDITEIPIEDALVYKTSNATVTPGTPTETLSNYVSGYAACSEGDVFVLTAYGSTSTNYLLWAFVGANGAMISKCASAKNNDTEAVHIAPKGAVYFIVNASANYTRRLIKGTTIEKKNQAEHMEKVISAGGSAVINPWQYIQTLWVVRDTLVERIDGLKYRSGLIPIERSWKSVELTASASKSAVITFLSAEPPTSSGLDLVPYFASGETDRVGAAAGQTETFIIPGDAKYLVVMLTSNSTDVTPDTVRIHGQVPDRVWNGLNVSILGDSISALKNYIPAGNDPYYGKSTDPSNSGITRPDQMWWGQTIAGLGGRPLIIDAWSGSCVTSGLYSGDDEDDPQPDTKTAMSDVSRCRNIHAYVQAEEGDEDALLVVESNPGDGEVLLSSIRVSPFGVSYTPAAGDYVRRIDPDIVIIEGGTNDYTYIDSAATFGTYDGHSSLDTSVTNTFREAYANMLTRIHAEYPKALVICLSGMFCKRPYTANAQTNRNSSSGKTMKDYNDAIREIAELHQGAYVDCYMSGFSRNNYYPTFASDRDTSSTHPNITGHKVIAGNLIPKLREVCQGYLAWLRGE